MKTLTGANLRSFLLAAAFLAGVGCATHASARSYLIDLNSRTATDLGPLGRTSYAHGVNDAGEVVGKFIAGYGEVHAFITGPNGMGMRDLGALGGDNSVANAINAAGQGVGVESGRAFITGPNGAGIMDLNSLVDLPDGLVLGEARGINNAGQVIATIIPEPESYALLLSGLALVAVVARRKKDIGVLPALS